MNIESNKTISAVIVNHNGCQEILNCLKSLVNQSFSLEKIIVVDNASTDNSQTAILRQYPEVDLIQLDQNLGLSKARNIGLEKALSDLVLILDHDIYVHKKTIHNLLAVHQKTRAAVICPRIVMYPDTDIIQCEGATPHFIGTLRLRHAHRPIRSLSAELSEVSGCIGACMLVDRTIVLCSGGFDEVYFFYFEDLEFCLRMRSFGYSILCEPKALVYHDRGEGTPGLSFRGDVPYPVRRAYFNIKHRLLTLLIHYRLQTLLVLFPALLLYEFATFAFLLKNGWFRIWWEAVSSLFTIRGYIKSRRKFAARNRRKKDKDLISGGALPFATGLTQSRQELTAIRFLSTILSLYWKIAKYMIG